MLFRSREQSRPELGFRLLKKLAEDVVDYGFVEYSPKQDGRNMIMVLGPTKKKADAMAEAQAEKDAAKARRVAGDRGEDVLEEVEVDEVEETAAEIVATEAVESVEAAEA